MRQFLLGSALLLGIGCGKSIPGPSVSIDPYALFYIRNDRPSGPIYYVYMRMPNGTDPTWEGSRLGSVDPFKGLRPDGTRIPGSEVCGSFGLESIIQGDPANMVQLVLMAYEDDRDPAGNDPRPAIDSLKSPTVDPFALGANTRETPHRFRLWLKADGSTFFDFGLWNETEKWAAAPGWPCPTSF